MDMLVAFACNDPRNGNSLQKFEHMELSQDGFFGVECSLFGPETSVIVNLRSYPIARVRVGTRSYPIQDYRPFVGNWCWDEVRMKEADARALLKDLLARGFKAEEYATRGPLADLVRPLQLVRG